MENFLGFLFVCWCIVGFIAVYILAFNEFWDNLERFQLIRFSVTMFLCGPAGWAAGFITIFIMFVRAEPLNKLVKWMVGNKQD